MNIAHNKQEFITFCLNTKCSACNFDNVCQKLRPTNSPVFYPGTLHNELLVHYRKEKLSKLLSK